jgi:hypothetical protein
MFPAAVAAGIIAITSAGSAITANRGMAAYGLFKEA